MLDFGLRDKVILVSGGASGIGRAVVDLAVAQGCRVSILDANRDAVDGTIGKLADHAAAVCGHCVDVRDTASVARVVEKTEDVLGPIYGFVNSAGISRPSVAVDMSAEDWDAVLDVNLKGSFTLAREVGRRMVERKNGSVVLISSVDGMGGHTARCHYTASKFGCIGLAKTLAIEWGRFGVRVNAIAPGVVDTALLRKNLATNYIDGVMNDRVPLARLSTGRDQAMAILFLLSEAASYVTGTVLTVDGGLTAGFFTHQHGAV